MAITAPIGFNQYVWEGSGGPLRVAVLAVAGLTASANNTVPHGLPAAPVFYVYAPEQTGWSEQKAADATNIYITVAAAGATAGNVVIFY